MAQLFFQLARQKTQAYVRTAGLFNTASWKKSKSAITNFWIRPMFTAPGQVNAVHSKPGLIDQHTPLVEGLGIEKK